MSLDVNLVLDHDVFIRPFVSYIRENGRRIGLTAKDWNERYPDARQMDEESMVETNIPFSANITGNLIPMAEFVCIYDHLWEPGRLGIEFAEQLIEPLSVALHYLWQHPEECRVFNPENGWGDYEGFVDFVYDYRNACIMFPDARVRAV